MTKGWRVVLISAICILIAFITGCGSSDISRDIAVIVQDCHSTDVNQSLFDRLNSSRVLVIADNAHGQWQPRQTVINLLEYWFHMAMQDSVSVHSSRKLALVLEVDSLHLTRILTYGSTANPHDILDVGLLCSGVFTTADMEFYNRLGSLLRRIESYNKSQEANRQITLSLFPGEIVIDLNDWSFDKRTEFFLHVRDSLISERILYFAKLHPDYKIIAFYGSAHLQRGIVPKTADGKSVDGRFLVGYLDSLLDDVVFTVGQVTPDYWNWSTFRDLFVITDKTYALPTMDINSEVRKLFAGPIRYDMVIVHPRMYNWGTPILAIPSIGLADLAISAMPDLMNTSNEYYRAYWPRLLGYLNAVSGKSPHRLNLDDPASLEHEYEIWKAWLDTTGINIVPDVESLRLWQRLLDSLANAYGPTAGQFEKEITSLLPNAPVLDDSNGMPTPLDRAAELREYIVSDSVNIVIDNLIGITWVGNDSERQSAMEALRRIADSSFFDPAQWSRWRREQTIRGR